MRAAIVGCGLIGRKRAKALSGAAVAVCCDLNRERAQSLAKEYDGKAVIGKLNVDNNPNVSMEFGVRNIPTILFFKNGKVVDKQGGAVPKAQLAAKLQAQL